MRTPLLVSLSLLFTAGCDQFYLNVDKDTALDTGEVELSPNPTIDVSWAETGIEIELSNGTDYEFTFGIVESTAECAVDTDYGCWTAEDCLNGYSSPDGDFIHSVYCHPLDHNGTKLTYSKSLTKVITRDDPTIHRDPHNAQSLFSGIAEYSVTPGSQTAFTAPTDEFTYEFSVTYYLQAVGTGSDSTVECWSWGVNPDYYVNEGCKSPIPIRLDSTALSSRHQRFELPLQSTWSP